MQLDYPFSKDKIGRGRSYPLRRSLLDQAFFESDLTQIHYVRYIHGGQPTTTIIDSEFCGETHRGSAGAGFWWIRVWSIASTERQQIEKLMVEIVLPRLMAWLKEIEQAGNVRRATSRCFRADYVDGGIRIHAN